MELTNRFCVIVDTIEDDINAFCNQVQKSCVDTSKTLLGYRERKGKELISDTTWKILDERKLKNL